MTTDHTDGRSEADLDRGAERPLATEHQASHLTECLGSSAHALIAGRLLEARDTLADGFGTLSGAGLSYAAAFTRAACGNVDRAVETIMVLAENDEATPTRTPEAELEHLTLANGMRTGVLSKVSACGRLAVRGTRGLAGEFVEDRDADAEITTFDAPDLGWDLIGSETAADLARGDVAAALLVRALDRRTWLHAKTRTRWTASRPGARAIVRVLRSGKPVPELASRSASPIDARVADLLTGLGWHPFEYHLGGGISPRHRHGGKTVH
jgi:hypothetical protein